MLVNDDLELLKEYGAGNIATCWEHTYFRSTFHYLRHHGTDVRSGYRLRQQKARETSVPNPIVAVSVIIALNDEDQEFSLGNLIGGE